MVRGGLADKGDGVARESRLRWMVAALGCLIVGVLSLGASGNAAADNSAARRAARGARED